MFDIFIAHTRSLANQYFTLYSTKEFFNTIGVSLSFPNSTADLRSGSWR